MVINDSWVRAYNGLALAIIVALHNDNGLDFAINNGEITEVDDNGNQI